LRGAKVLPSQSRTTKFAAILNDLTSSKVFKNFSCNSSMLESVVPCAFKRSISSNVGLKKSKHPIIKLITMQDVKTKPPEKALSKDALTRPS